MDIIIGILILSMLFIFGIGATIIEPIKAEVFHFDFSLLFLIMPGITIGTLAIVAGISAIRRRRWGWALAGSIAAALVPIPLGIVAIVLLVLSQKMFK